MNISISVAATPCAMPQIMFAGDLEARCALLAGLGYDGIDMFFPDPQGTDARTAKAALDRNGLRAAINLALFSGPMPSMLANSSSNMLRRAVSISSFTL